MYLFKNYEKKLLAALGHHTDHTMNLVLTRAFQTLLAMFSFFFLNVIDPQ
jgi:hypothetical protein